MLRLSLCLPHNSDGGPRDRILAWTEQYWRSHLPEAEILIGGPGGPNARSRNRNWLVQQAHGDVIALFDADVIAPPDAVRSLAAQAAASGMMGKFQRHAWLTRSATEAWLSRLPESSAFPQDKDLTHTAAGHPGFEFIARRDTFEALGGFGEEFIGWGAEDTSFMVVAATLAGIAWSRARSVHFWHPPAPGGKTDKRDPAYLRNRRLAQAYGDRLGQPEAMRTLLRERRGQCR